MQTNPIPVTSRAQQVDQSTRDALTYGAIVGLLCLIVFWGWQKMDEANLSTNEARAIAAGDDPAHMWPVAHPVVSALAVFVIVTIGLRLYWSMRHIEDRS